MSASRRAATSARAHVSVCARLASTVRIPPKITDPTPRAETMCFSTVPRRAHPLRVGTAREGLVTAGAAPRGRSEERRVGKECRARGSADQEKEKEGGQRYERESGAV